MRNVPPSCPRQLQFDRSEERREVSTLRSRYPAEDRQTGEGERKRGGGKEMVLHCTRGQGRFGSDFSTNRPWLPYLTQQQWAGTRWVVEQGSRYAHSKARQGSSCVVLCVTVRYLKQPSRRTR